MRHETSVPVTISAPARAWSAMRSRPMSARERLLRHRERAAEPAALVGPGERHELDPAEPAEQPLDLVRARQEQLARDAEAELAQPVTALVQRDLVREPPVRRLHSEDVHEELAQLVRARLELGKPSAPERNGS